MFNLNEQKYYNFNPITSEIVKMTELLNKTAEYSSNYLKAL
jgi:hypothetical protein